jgi:iron complex transport system substrate-binding protein
MPVACKSFKDTLAVMREYSRCFLIVLVVSCTANQETTEGDYTDRSQSYPALNNRAIQIMDDSGKLHLFRNPPERIISLVPSATETLLALGVREKIVGRTDYDNLSELIDLPSVGDGLQPNLEILVSLDPDLVIRFEGESNKHTEENLSKMEITNFAIRPESIADIKSIIKRLGKITRKTSAADSILGAIEGTLNEVAIHIEGLPRKKVAYLLGGNPPWVSGPGTYIHELITAVGAENALGDLQESYAQISVEELITRKIDLILISEGQDVPQILDTEYISVPLSVEIPGPRLGEATKTIASLIYPKAFK